MKLTSAMASGREQGFSLVEILVAMTIGLVVLGGVMQALLTNQRNAAWADDVAYIQDSARYAMEVIARDVRGAGYWGCAAAGGEGVTMANAVAIASGDDWIQLSGVQGYEDGSSLPGDLVGAVPLWQDSSSFAGNDDFPPDALMLRSADVSAEMTLKRHNINNNKAKLFTTQRHDFEVGELVVVNSEDCLDIALVQVTALGNSRVEHQTGSSTKPGNCTRVARLDGDSFDCDSAPASGGSAFVAGSTLMRYDAVGYFIGTSMVDASQPALYRVEYSGIDDDGAVLVSRDEVALGVEDMQVLYGLDTDGDAQANTYVRAAQIDGVNWLWNQVVGLRISLLIRGYGANRQDTAALNYIGYPYAGDDDSYPGHSYSDSVVRQQVSKTIRLRNSAAG